MRKLLSIFIVVTCYCAYPQATELIVNGDFSSSQYWSTGPGWSISDDSARYTPQGGRYSLTQANDDLVVSVKPNTNYLLQFDIIVPEGSARIQITSSDGTNYFSSEPYTRIISGSLVKWIEFTTPFNIGAGGFSIRAYSDHYQSFVIDNISLMEADDVGNSPYFVAVDGNDAASGDIKNPWKTPEKAFRTAQTPGDTVYFRGGRYLRKYLEGGIHVVFADSADNNDDLAYSGESGNYIHFWGYPPDIANGDSVIFDFKNVEEKSTGLYIGHVGYWHMKNLVFRNLYQKSAMGYAVGINGYGPHNMIYEQLTIDTVGGWGMFSSTYDWYSRGRTDSTYWINCDFHHCIDSFAVGQYQLDRDWAGTQAVGLFVVSYPGCYYEYDGCRSWQNADDGYNFAGPGPHRVKNTWSFINGIYFEHLGLTSSGNGYKVNSSYDTDRLNIYPDQVTKYMTNTISAYNHGLGYTENKGGAPSQHRNMYNNIAWNNEQGFVTQGSDPDGWEHRDNRYINNIAYNNRAYDVGEYTGAYFETNLNNSWTDPPGITVNDADFVISDSVTIVNQLKTSRKSDGSLPDITAFRLAEGSDLIDAGTDVGLPYNGIAPDLGPFEFEYKPGTNNKYPSVEITTPSNGSKYVNKNSLKISVNAADDGTISTLELFNNDTLLDMTSESFLSYTWNNPPEGTFSFRAVATDDQGARATSSRVSVTIVSGGFVDPMHQNCFEARIFENITRDSFLLELPKGLPVDTDLSIYSLEAKKVEERKLSQTNTRVEYLIDISSLDGATYYILKFDNNEGYQPCQPFDPKIFKY